MSEHVPSEVSDFKVVPEGGLKPEIRDGHNATILELEINDKQQKLKARKWIGGFLVVLLIAQNIALFFFVKAAYQNGDLSSLATVISVISTATLVETAAIVHTMVRWIFSEMQFTIR